MDLLYEKLRFSIAYGMTYGSREGCFSLPFEPIVSRFKKSACVEIVEIRCWGP